MPSTRISTDSSESLSPTVRVVGFIAVILSRPTIGTAIDSSWAKAELAPWVPDMASSRWDTSSRIVR